MNVRVLVPLRLLYPVLLHGEIGRFAMPSAKERMKEVIEAQPDDSTYEEILRELAFARMIDRGLDDSRAGRTVSNEEMQRRIGTWQK